MRGIEWCFRKALGAIYLIAFASLASQVTGLIGQHGILPATEYLRRVQEYLGSEAYTTVPTIFWLDASDIALRAICVAGALCGVFILAGYFERVALVLAYIFYLSLSSVSQVFLGYQWDALLLETGFLAIFLGYSPLVDWLFRWLLFRLVFQSGAVKLLSGDATWRNLTALTYHYQTQPIPTPLAWYANHLPAWFQKFSCGAMFAVELLLPFLIFTPPRLRAVAGCGLVGLQLLIAATGNYCFFNLLAISLCLFTLDDAWLPHWVRERPARPSIIPAQVRRVLVGAVAVFIALMSGLWLCGMLLRRDVGRSVLELVASYQIVNTYGLFAVMTTTRPEIVVEGSGDGIDWREYEFKFKPGRLDRAPPFVAPHQPRLDWQMWFAALSNYRENPWFVAFVRRLLEGSPEVLRLIERNPFPGHPPRYVRARVYEYRFTKSGAHAWWTRELLGTYLRAVSLEDFG